jgi:hypothetical protein
MQKLNKADLALKAVHLDRLTTASEALKREITDFNNCDSGWTEVTKAMTAFNTLIGEANEFIEEIHSRQESYSEDRADPWHESDAGETYAEWAEAWEIELDTIELEKPTGDDDLEEPDFDQLEEFEGLPDSKDDV